MTYHLQNIFKTEELEENRNTQKIRVVQKEGGLKNLLDFHKQLFYNYIITNSK